jgi:hypothetical protein
MNLDSTVECNAELESIANLIGGDVLRDVTDFETEPTIQISTGDNTSKENYDDLLDVANDIRQSGLLKNYKIHELEAEHDYQFITFIKVSQNE